MMETINTGAYVILDQLSSTPVMADYNDTATGNLSDDYPGHYLDFDTSKIPYMGHFKNHAVWEVVIKVFFYVIVMLMSLVGNSLVVYIVWRNRSMRTTTNFFIVNLAVSDLMVTCSCTWVHLVDDLTEGWVLGAFFCKFNSFAQVLSLVSSIMTLTLISCDRFFGIVFAMQARMTDKRSPVFILIIWICAIGISSPLLVYRQQFTREWLNHTEVWCGEVWPAVTTFDPITHSAKVTQPSRTFFYTFISVVLFFFPILVMTLAYSLIIWKLWSTHLPGERIESEVRAQNKIKKKVVLMLVIILSVFAVCWLPFQISVLYTEHIKNMAEQLPNWYHKFSYFANYIAYSNSAFNPIIYTGFNENFKKGFKYVFRCGRRPRCKQTYSAITGETSYCGNMTASTAMNTTIATGVTKI